MNARKRTAIFSRFKKANPKPTTELRYRSRYQLLVAVVLSAQATDIGVNKASRELFKVAGTPKKMVALGLRGLKCRIASSSPSLKSGHNPMNARKRAAIFSRFKKANPKPTTELRYRSRYQHHQAHRLSQAATQ